MKTIKLKEGEEITTEAMEDADFVARDDGGGMWHVLKNRAGAAGVLSHSDLNLRIIEAEAVLKFRESVGAGTPSESGICDLFGFFEGALRFQDRNRREVMQIAAALAGCAYKETGETESGTMLQVMGPDYIADLALDVWLSVNREMGMHEKRAHD